MSPGSWCPRWHFSQYGEVHRKSVRGVINPPDHKSHFNPQTTPFLMGAIEVIFWVQFLKSSIAITSRTYGCELVVLIVQNTFP